MTQLGPVQNRSSEKLDFLVSGLGQPTLAEDLDAELSQPRLYFGDQFSGYAIVGGKNKETDFQIGNESIENTYDGDAGVGAGSIWRRSAFALRFGEINPLIWGGATSESKVILNRDVSSRVRELAPFLEFDDNPYPVMHDGEIVWVIDGYTTTDRFPYSQSASTSLQSSSDLHSGYNYVRNSVKATVDAYNGEVNLYVVNDSDPLINAWRQAFPDLFKDISAADPKLVEHFRYPEDIFTAQTDMYSRYVVDDPVDFIKGDITWSVVAQPPTEAQVQESDLQQGSTPGSMQPQYLMAQLPDSDEAEFVLQRAFKPVSGAQGSQNDRPELRGVMMARSDPENYGQLVLYRIESEEVPSPLLVHSTIRKNEDLTRFIKDTAGAKVQFGDMTMLVLKNTILYIRPVYVEANSDTAVPELQKIIAANGDRIHMADTVAEAVAGVIDPAAMGTGVEPNPPVEGEDPPAIETPVAGAGYDATGKSVLQLRKDAVDLLVAAEEAEAVSPEQAAQLRARALEALQAQGALLDGS